MSRPARLGWLGMLGAVACTSERAAGNLPRNPERGAVDTTVPPSRPPDSLVATAPGGVQLWFTLARPDSGPAGRCVDRTIEIRRDGRRIPVPLLYTGAVPELVNDSTARARLSTHCRPGDVYLVDLRTGRPTREVR